MSGRSHSVPSLLAPYLTSVEHLTIAVRDLKAAVRFYTKVLGFELSRFRRRRAGSSYASALLWAGPLKVVLVEGRDPDSAVARYIADFGPGLYSLSLGVNDLFGLVERLKAAGMAFDHTIMDWPGERRILSPRDECSGMKFSFVESFGGAPSGASLPNNVERGPWPSVVEPSKSA